MDPQNQPPVSPGKKRYVRAVGPRLRLLLYAIFGLVALLGANSAYLSSISLLEWVTGLRYQNYFYQYMFLGHLLLGFLLLIPFFCFAGFHIRNAYRRPNRRAVRAGVALFTIGALLLLSGVALTRLGIFQIKNPIVRSTAFWIHVATPLLAVWLYILHRLAGPRIKWKAGLGWGGVMAAAVLAMVLLHSQDPRKWNVVGPKEGERYFYPSLARTASGNFIPARDLMMDRYCMQCHHDIYEDWFHSVHHFSSFNNPAYRFSVRETRKVALKRDGNVKASRWCAGCHDPVPFFSGAFDNPHYDDVHDPTSQAGISCTVCHSITHVNSTRGNADYTIEQPILYPFTFSSSAILRFINRQLIKAKPEFHKKTFLKPLHRTAAFCSTCHKVSIPYALNHYKAFLRGQDHYDSFLLSGVSGHGSRSFYYPPKAQKNCNGCHMPLQPSDDFGAKFYSLTNHVLSVHNHLFLGANTAIPAFHGWTQIVAAQQRFLKNCVRVDIFGIKEGGRIDGRLSAPLRPAVPVLQPGETYLVEVVLRTLTVGHHLTQGTTDSNQLWVGAKLSSGDRVVGRSGGLGHYNAVDPWSHFVDVYMLDRNGHRVDRRNVQDIFTPLYNHQIPPGAGQVVHFAFTVPRDLHHPLILKVRFLYRKFDATYMRYVFGPNHTNDLPITTMASDQVVFPVAGVPEAPINAPSPIPEWQRWNDYGIGLLLEGNHGSEKGELAQAEVAFRHVEQLHHPDGPLNLARVYLKEGRLDKAVAALQRAARFKPAAQRWTVAWLTGRVDEQNGFLDQAITEFRSILDDHYPEIEQRGFDFTKDYILRNELGLTYFERAKQEQGSDRQSAHARYLRLAARQFEQTLKLDSENATAHYNLAQIYSELGDSRLAALHQKLHDRYRPDDNARDRAIEIARRSQPAANFAAQAIVIYPLQRAHAPGLTGLGTNWVSDVASARFAQPGYPLVKKVASQ